MGNHRNWTEEEDQFLRDHYRSGRSSVHHKPGKPGLSAAVIGVELGKTKNMVIGRARHLGLHKKRTEPTPPPPPGGYKKPWRPGDPVPEHLRLEYRL
jgi:hypothetical protein